MYLSCQLGASLDDGVVDDASLHGVDEIDDRQRCLVRLVLEVFDLGALPSFTQLKKTSLVQYFNFSPTKQSQTIFPCIFCSQDLVICPRDDLTLHNRGAVLVELGEEGEVVEEIEYLYFMKNNSGY